MVILFLRNSTPSTEEEEQAEHARKITKTDLLGYSPSKFLPVVKITKLKQSSSCDMSLEKVDQDLDPKECVKPADEVVKTPRTDETS